MGKTEKILIHPAGMIVLAVLCNILWGSAFPFVKIGYGLFGIGVRPADNILFAGIRFILAGGMVLIFSTAKERRFPKPRRTRNILCLALVQTVIQYSFFYIGLSHTTGSNGSIVNSTSTFFALIAAHLAYRDDRLSFRKITGVLLGFAGVLAVTLEQGSFRFSLTGEGFLILAAASFAVSSLLNKHASQWDDSAVVTGYNLLIGGAVLAVLGLAGGGALGPVTGRGLAVLLYLALLSAAAFTLWAALLKYHPVGKISVYNFVIPISGTVLSALFLKENIFTLKYLISLFLVCLGIIIVNSNKKIEKALSKEENI